MHNGGVEREGHRLKPAFLEVMALRGLAAPSADEVEIVGSDPTLATPFKIGECCASVLAGVGVAVSDIWEMKTGRRQHTSIDVNRAAAALKSAKFLERAARNGGFESVVNEARDAVGQMTNPWPTKDGKHFMPHFGLPHLADRVLNILGCEATAEGVRGAVAKWDALDLEDAIDEARGCGAMVRSNADWLSEPHGQMLHAKPLVEIEKIADSAPEPFAADERRPLDGTKVLDLTRILAGPIAARTLAEHGADVLMVGADGLPQVPEYVVDTSHGKRSCFLDLKETDGRAKLKQLVSGADVFSQGYRPGILSGLGFGPDELAELRPRLIYLSISCFGSDGPFSHRAGWEQIGQAVTGICHEGSAEGPKRLPAAACDYTTGYLGAYGVLLALARRAKEGGSYHVRVSLCQSGMFIYRQGKLDNVSGDADIDPDVIDQIRIETNGDAGQFRHLGPILKLSETQPYWIRPTPLLGADAPAWL